MSDDDFYDAREFEDSMEQIETPCEEVELEKLEESFQDMNTEPVKPKEQPERSVEKKFSVINKDTGEIFDIREIHDQIPIDKYSMFPVDFVPPQVPQTSSTEKPPKQGLKFFKRKVKLDEQGRKNSVQVLGNKKAVREFDKLLFSQVLSQHEGPIWAMKFSWDGTHLCSAGQDTILRIWVVDESLLEQVTPSQPNSLGGGHETDSTSGEKVFLNPIPLRQYQGHTGPIVDISWSRTKFILSSSMDKTVRLWHVSKEECLHFFQHPDSVPAVDFHPKEDRYFVSGCFDNRVRIWDITDGRVVSWTPTHAMITAACFLPCGSMVVVGLLNGQCTFYQTERLVYYTQIECRNEHGPFKKGRKVTGLQFSPGGKYLLVTTNDSRMRLFCMDDYSRACKYKGLLNDNLQIKGHFSQNGDHIICGSENGQVYIWNTTCSQVPSVSLLKSSKHDRNAYYEYFNACNAQAGIITVALFAPVRNADRTIDTSSCTRFIITASYEGTIKVFEKPKAK